MEWGHVQPLLISLCESSLNGPSKGFPQPPTLMSHLLGSGKSTENYIPKSAGSQGSRAQHKSLENILNTDFRAPMLSDRAG